MSKALIVEKHLEWMRPSAWIAVDDEGQGWSDDELAGQVVLTPALEGLANAEVQAKLYGLLVFQFGPPTKPSSVLQPHHGGRPPPSERQRQLAEFLFDPVYAQQFTATASARKYQRGAPRPRILVLGLQGTLFRVVEGALILRPHLFNFLESCADLFERIVVFPEDHDWFRAAAESLARQGDVPEWFAQVDRLAWDGRTKDLTKAGVFDLQEALLVDDNAEYVAAGQEAQRICLSTFDGAPQDRELLRVYELLEQAVQTGPGRIKG